MKQPQYYSRFAQTHATHGGNLPHWSQWCATFTTFRLADSLPEGRLEQLRAEREEWLRAHGIEPHNLLRDEFAPCQHTSPSPCEHDSAAPCEHDSAPPCEHDSAPTCQHDSAAPWRRGVLTASDELKKSSFDAERTPRLQTIQPQTLKPQTLQRRLTEAERSEYRELFSKRFHAWLDAGHGSCVLGDPNARAVVEASLQHFADVRYSLYGFVVKPNHVHVLFMPEEGFDSRVIVANWKRFTAREINRLLRREGVLWQKESYDRLVRDPNQFNACRAYIRQNDPNLAYDAYAEIK